MYKKIQTEEGMHKEESEAEQTEYKRLHKDHYSSSCCGPYNSIKVKCLFFQNSQCKHTNLK